MSLRNLGWLILALAGAVAWGMLAIHRGETISAGWLVLAAVGTYLIGFRFYSRFLADRVFGLNDRRATPAERLNNGRDFVPTQRWVLFGHHFAAIAGAGPLVGPVLAAQFGYLPGTIWIVFGVVLGGSVQDFIILFGSMRRDGKSLGQMAKEETGPITGLLAMVAVLAIMVILLAVLALVVVNALKDSPWGVFTILCTIPVAILMGFWMKVWRPGRTLEASVFGVALLLLALVGGRYVAQSPTLAPWFTYSGPTIAYGIIAYGFIASVLPVWMLLCPRDYLSTFMKIGTILLLALGIMLVLPPIKLPAVTRFVDGTGPVFAGKLFPFAFITIACGAISGFHALVSSGTTPKMLTRESDARLIGYGGMLMESFVAVMAICAAALLDPGIYFAINAPLSTLGGNVQSAAEVIRQWGFSVTPDQIQSLAASVGEKTLLGRTGGAPSLAVGMAHIFSSAFGTGLMALWYHFAIMFEALFILTTVDTGTRVGRFMLQELAGQVWAPLGRTSWYPSTVLASAVIVAGWGYFLVQGVLDPLGGINSLWPLFGISNQLLASVALCVGTTILIKSGKARFAWVTLLPLAWVVAATFTAGWQKVFADDPRLGFLAHASSVTQQVAAGTMEAARGARLIFNDRLDAVITLAFLIVTLLVLLASTREWMLVLTRRKPAKAQESPFVETAYAG
ncbi:MAG TPA: carbon starvation CstA family protein [Gemmatimonadales bacterium]|jgi:carbon starvation protein|nr:carbon starvation CstA family protein [Gemmatimonadales bacterium]